MNTKGSSVYFNDDNKTADAIIQHEHKERDADSRKKNTESAHENVDLRAEAC